MGRAIVLQMQGKVQEASAITSTMNETEQASAVEVLGRMIERRGAKQAP